VSLLVDTNVLLWLLAGSTRLRQEIVDTLADPRNGVYVSTVSIWEVAIKVGIGRLNAPPDLARWLPPALVAARLSILPIDMQSALGVEQLPFHHADPFDRLLIVQARLGGYTLVSADRIFDRYDVSLLRC
jgi:PIN domain nuclease of toxin-antitoxin system